MKKYEYKFVRVDIKGWVRLKPSDTFEKCKEIIVAEAENGWRLKQVVTPINEISGANDPLFYEIIFEREI